MKYYLQLITLLILTGNIISGCPGAVVSIAPVSITVGNSGTADITLDSVPQGMSGYQMTVSSDNQAVVTVTSVTFPSWASLSEAIPGDSGSFALRAIDLNSGVEAGATNVKLATLNLLAAGAGSAQITIGGVQIDDDSGNIVQAETKSGVITISGSNTIPSSTPTVTSTPTQTPTPTPAFTPIPTLTPAPQENKVTLNTGWNLVNIPMQLSEGSNTAAIFKAVQSAGHSILTYNGSGGWITIGKNDELSPMTGYWIYTTSPLSVSLSVNGQPTESKPLTTGWNLAGITGTSSKSVDSALSSLSSWTYVVPYDSATQQYKDASIRGDTNAQTLLSPYDGFWIYLETPGSLIPAP